MKTREIVPFTRLNCVCTKMMLVLAFVFLAAGMAFGQLPMTRSVFSGTYTPITVGGGATVSSAVGDDGTQTLIPIGFTFNYLGNNFTTVDVCTNGWLSFAAAGANSWTNVNLFVATTPNNTIAPWWDDLNLGTGQILYQTQGTPGSQTFTMQWTNCNSYNGGTRQLNFQAILYEGTNVIEFHYGTFVGPFNTAESASIGLENGTGGPGNFLDATSGSSLINNSYLNTSKWPGQFYRFTPGAPGVLAGGSYTVGTAGTYPTLTEALANVNHRGISGPITLSLLDALYDTTLAGGRNTFPMMLGPVAGNSITNTITIQPAAGTSTLTYEGVVSGSGGNIASATAFGTTTEMILGIIGTDYVTVGNLNLNTTLTGIVDRGLYVANASATDGAQFNTFENISVTLLRSAGTNSIGIQQNTITTPTAVAGANSNNAYRNLTITNSYAGMYCLGNATYPDLNTIVGNTSPTAFNTIGGPAAFDIGGGASATQTYGIRINNQSSARVFNNAVNNVSATTTTDGILCELAQGTCEIYNNKVANIKNNSTTSTAGASGIRANTATTSTHAVRVYNNFVSEINSAYTGAATATRIIRGIYVQSAGGGTVANTVSVDANNVKIDGSLSPNTSNACFEIGTTSGPVMQVRNNIFANFTGAQAGVALHVGWYSTSATVTGNTGSISDYNDLYVLDPTNGFVGRGNTTNFATLANWQAAMVGQDAASLSVGPSFISPTDLHVTAAALNNVGSVPVWVTTDIDNTARSGAPDIGADEFTPAVIDMATTALVAPLAGACYSATEQVTIRIRNNSPNPIDFSLNNTTVTCNITGAVTATLVVTLTDNTLNGGSPLAAGDNLDVPMGTINMTASGTYTFNANTIVAGDGTPANDAMPVVNISVNTGSITPTTTPICSGDSVVLTASGYTGTSIQWEFSTNGGASWANLGGGITPAVTVFPTDTTLYRVFVCGNFHTDTALVNVSSATDPTLVGDTVCGFGTVTLTASGGVNYDWFTTPTGGTSFFNGPVYTPSLTMTTTYFVENKVGGGAGFVGPLNNLIGAGAQSTAPQWVNFNVLSTATILSMVVYPGAAGNVVLDMFDATGVTLINTFSFPVNAGQVGTAVVVPVNWTVAPGTYRLYRNAASVSLYRNSTGAVYPYTLPGVLTITGNSFDPNYHYWGYNWNVSAGCVSNRLPVTGVVTPSDTVTLLPIAPSICNGDTILLVASSINTNYTYDWTPGTALNDSTIDSVWAFPSSSILYEVLATDAGSGCAFVTSVMVTVNPLPFGSASQSDSLICIGDSVQLITLANPQNVWMDNTAIPITDLTTTTDSMLVSGLPNSIPVGGLLSVCVNITHTWDGDITLSLISPSGVVFLLFSAIGGSGDNFTNTCFTVSAVANINTGVAPFTGDWIPMGAGGLATFDGLNPNGWWKMRVYDGAGGDQGTLDNWTLTFNFPPANHSWTSDPAGFSSTLDTVWASPVVSTVYFATISDMGTGCQTILTLPVDVNPPLSLTTFGDTICAGGNALLYGIPAGGDGNYTFDWGPYGANDTAMVNAVTDMYASVTLTDGCGTPVVLDSALINVTDSVGLIVALDTTVCAGQSVTLTATGTSGDGTYTYFWNTGDTTGTISVSPIVTTAYTVTVTDGCGTTDNDGATISVFDAVTALLIADTTICQGDSVTLTATGGLGDGTFAYLWSTGATTPTITVTPTGTSVYSVTISDGCGTMADDSATVDITALPVAGFTWIDNGDSTVSFFDMSTGATSWFWDFGDGGTDTIQNPTHDYGVNGDFIATLIVSNACGADTFIDSTSILLSVSGLSTGFDARIYPNPNAGNFHLRIAGIQNAKLLLEVVTIFGQQVFVKEVIGNGHVLDLPIELDASKGVYFLRVSDGTSIKQYKVVVQ